MGRKIAKIITIGVAISLFVGLLSPIGTVDSLAQAFTGDNTISMTEVYNGGEYGIDFSGKEAVTIASKEELEMLQQYVEDGEKTEGISFRQTADIIMSSYEFSYDEESKRAGIYLDGKLLGAVGRDGRLFEDFTSTDETTWKAQGIVLEEQALWKGIGSYNNFFNGCYDGGSYGIRGIWSPGNDIGIGLFECNGINGEIKNINIESSLFVSKGNTGSIVVHNNGIVKNCSVKTIIIAHGTSGYNKVGGIVGMNYGIVSHCISSGAVSNINSAQSTGGCVGESEPSGMISWCKFLGYESLVISDAIMVGGIVGAIRSDSAINNCLNEGRVYVNSTSTDVGGIVGSGEGNIWQCENYGDIISRSSRSGGIAGGCSREIYQCINYASVPSGGIVGSAARDTTIINCENRGYAGRAGIVYLSTGAIRVENCLNCADLGANIAEIMWMGSSTVERTVIQNCLGIGTLIYEDIQDSTSYDSEYSGILCRSASNVTLKNCYYMGGKVMGEDDAEDVIIESCFPVTYAQVRGQETEQRISDDETGYAYTTSVVDALNNAVTAYNERNLALELGKEPYMQWELDEMGLPTICGVGVGEPEEELESPSPSPTLEPTPSDCHEEPTATPSWEPEQPKEPSIETIPPYDVDVTEEPTNSPANIIEPQNTPTQIPSAAPTNGPSAESVPRSTPTNRPPVSSTPTNQPPASSTPSITPAVPVIAVASTPSSAAVGASSGGISTGKTLHKVTGFQVQVTRKLKVKLQWGAVSSADGYIIYRSAKKNTGFHIIKTVKGKVVWKDSNVKKGKSYYYKICAYIGTGDNQQKSTFVRSGKVTVPWYQSPVVAYTKGRTGNGERCLIVRLKKYKGAYVEISIRQKGKKYKKLKLNDSRIRTYKGRLRLTYSKRGRVFFCRVRTYNIVKKKKRYSAYSVKKKIRL